MFVTIARCMRCVFWHCFWQSLSILFLLFISKLKYDSLPPIATSMLQFFWERFWGLSYVIQRLNVSSRTTVDCIYPLAHVQNKNIFCHASKRQYFTFRVKCLLLVTQIFFHDKFHLLRRENSVSFVVKYNIFFSMCWHIQKHLCRFMQKPLIFLHLVILEVLDWAAKTLTVARKTFLFLYMR